MYILFFISAALDLINFCIDIIRIRIIGDRNLIDWMHRSYPGFGCEEVTHVVPVFCFSGKRSFRMSEFIEPCNH